MVDGKQENKAAEWSWDIDLEPLIGTFIRIETNESMYRSGRLSGVVFKDLSFVGDTVRFPMGLELNGDPTDIIPFELIKVVEAVW